MHSIYPLPPFLLSFSCNQQQEQDPTNLYISNLPLSVDEKELENMLQPFGQVVSTRILRDYSGNSRGVGFARSVAGVWRRRLQCGCGINPQQWSNPMIKHNKLTPNEHSFLLLCGNGSAITDKKRNILNDLFAIIVILLLIVVHNNTITRGSILLHAFRPCSYLVLTSIGYFHAGQFEFHSQTHWLQSVMTCCLHRTRRFLFFFLTAVTSFITANHENPMSCKIHGGLTWTRVCKIIFTLNLKLINLLLALKWEPKYLLLAPVPFT